MSTEHLNTHELVRRSKPTRLLRVIYPDPDMRVVLVNVKEQPIDGFASAIEPTPVFTDKLPFPAIFQKNVHFGSSG